MGAKSEAAEILKGVAKGLLSIPFPPKQEKPEEIKLHWCPQCKKYHRAP